MKKAPPPKPSLYTPELGETICDHILEPMSLAAVAAQEGMPDKRTITRWLARGSRGEEPYAEFLALYIAAKELQADIYEDELLDIADDGAHDYKTVKRRDGEETEELDAEHIQRSKIRISTRQWLMERAKSKRYGAKTALIGGGPGDPPLRLQVARIERVLVRPPNRDG